MKRLILLITMVFLVGFLSNSLFSVITSENAAVPIFRALNSFSAPTGLYAAKELDSPGNHIPMESIHVYGNKVVLDIEDVEWSVFSNTNSMDPVLDEDSNGIEIKPKSPEQINAGDIISYRSSIVNAIIVHRVISIGEDEQGWFAIAKGDNNPREDPEKIRFSQVHGIVVAIIY